MSEMTEAIGMTQNIKLPSQGKVYSEGHPFHKRDSIDINLLTGADENLLTTKSLIQSGQLIDKLLKRVIIDDVDIDSLLLGDKYAVLIFARIYSLGTDYEAICSCEYCRASDKYPFELGNVPITNLGEIADQVNEYENHFKFTTTQGKEIEFRLATVKSSKIVDRDVEAERNFHKKRKVFNKADKLILHTYRNLIISIDGSENREEIDKFLNSSITESREFRKHMKDISPTVEFLGSFYCTECGKENIDVALDFNENFFWSDF